MGEANNEPHHTENVRECLQQVQSLLGKHVSMGAQQQEMARAGRHGPTERWLQKRQLTELREELDGLHSADIAYILGALPIARRSLVWEQVKPERNGEVLIAVPDAIREPLIAGMSREQLLSAVEQLDADEIADLAPALPAAVMRDVFKSLSINAREQLRAAMSCPEGTVGALMDFDMVTIREDVTLGAVSRYLRRFDQLPDHTDQLFVVDRDRALKGTLPLGLLLVNGPEVRVSSLMTCGGIRLQADEKAVRAARAFERHGLVSAPVVSDENKLLGRVTVSAVVNHIRSGSERDALDLVGLHGKEDVFAPVWKSVQNRWLWLALKLCAAFLASRVIGGFESTIAKFVALATLMPIVANIAGHSANQTAAIIIRLLAQGQITSFNARRLMVKELAIAGVNGLVWGGVAGLFAYLLYRSVPLGMVMVGAMIFNFLLGAGVGILAPLAMQRMGRNPASGSSVMLTAVTDSGGFFIFLGLATIFLIH